MNQRITAIAIAVSIVAVLFLALFSAGGSNIHLVTRYYREMLVLGGLIGGWLGGLIGVEPTSWISSILIGIGGSCLLIWLMRKIFK